MGGGESDNGPGGGEIVGGGSGGGRKTRGGSVAETEFWDVGERRMKFVSHGGKGEEKSGEGGEKVEKLVAREDEEKRIEEEGEELGARENEEERDDGHDDESREQTDFAEMALSVEAVIDNHYLVTNTNGPIFVGINKNIIRDAISFPCFALYEH